MNFEALWTFEALCIRKWNVENEEFSNRFAFSDFPLKRGWHSALFFDKKGTVIIGNGRDHFYIFKMNNFMEFSSFHELFRKMLWKYIRPLQTMQSLYQACKRVR